MGAVAHGLLARCRAACWQVAFIIVPGQPVSCLVRAVQAVRARLRCRGASVSIHTLATLGRIPMDESAPTYLPKIHTKTAREAINTRW